MKKLLIFLVLVGYTSLNYSQTLIQTFTDRCTGATQVFQIAMTGTTTVVFYNRAKTFTAADVSSGVFQAWLEETYLWWSQLNPCSANQATATTTQQTAQQTASAATEAATSAATAAASTPPTTDATSTPTTPPTTSTSDSGSTSTDAPSTDTSSTDSSQSTESSTDTSDSSGESGGSTEDSSESSTEETSSEETSSEESSDSESEESVEEESSEESSEESKEEEKEEKKEKKKNLAPPVLASNLMTNQMLDQTWSTAASFGLSQSSLTGQETYSANLMLWSNFKQFSLGLGKSKIHFWSEYEDMAWTVNSHTGVKTPAINYFTKKRYVDRQTKIHHIGSVSLNYMYLYGTSVLTTGYSAVFLGQKDDMFKGFAGGYAATGSFIFLPQSTMLSPALTFFGTKPLAFKTLPRWTFSPMLAISLTPIQVFYTEKQVTVAWNEYFTYIIGSNVNFNLTQRFTANLGINTINNTNPIIPTTFAITIGARFAF